MTLDLLTAETKTGTQSDVPMVFLPYQQEWMADNSQLKVGEKSRRIGLTWAEAADNVLIASSTAEAGGMNCYYIGYNMDMAIEYIEACASWAKTFSNVVAAIEEGEEIFKDGKDEKAIKTWTIKFASGFRIVALSSRPANLRGKQGVVIIDEAAFHDSLDELIKAALALLIWGGKVRIISTHNGDKNDFNTLINDIRSGSRSGSIHRTDFSEAIEQGLFKRICLRGNKAWTQETEDAWKASVYKFYGDASREELDVIPAQGSGAWLSAALIEARMHSVPVLRYTAAVGFEQRPEADREADIKQWLDLELAPLLAKLNPQWLSCFGMDFARSSDLSVITPCQLADGMKCVVPFQVELRNMPHAQQFQILKYIADRLPRFSKAAIDAGGNGSAVAEFMAQKYGYHRIELIKFTETWYRENMPPLKRAFEDDTILIPRDADVLNDLRMVKLIDGIARVPALRTKGKDGGNRHGDSAIAIALMHYATRHLGSEIDFQSTGDGRFAAGAFDGGTARTTESGFGSITGNNDFQGFA